MSRGAQLIPRIIHRIWVGPDPLPETHRRYGETWREHHPDWEMRLWTDRELPELADPAVMERARHPAERADVLRYEVLRRFGGVYVDTDVEALRALDPLLAGIQAFAGYERPGQVCNAVLGGVPNHPLWARAASESARRAGSGRSFMEATANVFLGRLLEDFPDVTVFDREKFYPYAWYEPHRAGGPFPRSYAVHHWAKTWYEEPEAPEEKIEFLREKLRRAQRKRSEAERRADKLQRRSAKAQRTSSRRQAQLEALRASRWWRLHPARLLAALPRRGRRGEG